MVANPPAYNTKELVQSALFIGKKRSQINPKTTANIPIENIHEIFTLSSRSLRLSQVPIRTPKRPVATAGKVLRIPSGSQVLTDFHRCASVSIVRSSHAPKLVSFSRFAYPIPGTGTNVMSAQYAIRIPKNNLNWVF